MSSKYGWQHWMATAAIVGAIAAPGASASPVDGRGTSPGLKAYIASQDDAGGNANGGSRSPETRVVTVSSNGFQWSDAAIGAAAMFGAISVGAGVLLLTGRRRDRHLPRAIG